MLDVLFYYAVHRLSCGNLYLYNSNKLMIFDAKLAVLIEKQIIIY